MTAVGDNIYNYSAGPAVLPRAVHERLNHELHAHHGVPLLEMGHRTPAFDLIAESSESHLRELLDIPPEYAVLFMPGGARAQYFAVPMNLDGERRGANYFDTGYWSSHAIRQARSYIPVTVTASPDERQPWSLPAQTQWQFATDAAYTHYVANETLTGFEFFPAKIDDGSLVSDMTSNLLTAPVDIRRHSLIYASAQKNAGIAGLTIVILARDRIGYAHPETPLLYDYAVQTKAGSRYGTPAVLSWYVCSLVLEWIKAEGGVEEMYRRSVQRSRLIYTCIGESDIYESPVHADYRSRVNIFFRINPRELEAVFLARAKEQGLIGLRGHSATGGIRASLYNGMPLEGAKALEAFMREFERTTG